MKKVVGFILVLTMAICIVGCGKSNKEESRGLKIGVILEGGKKEAYSKTHIDGIKAAAKKVGLKDDSFVWKYNVPGNDKCAKTAEELVAQGCGLIIANSYTHQDFVREVADKYEDVDFVSIAGDHAEISDLDNYYNAFTRIYEAKYVAGVVAGMKIKELVDTKKMPDKSVDKDGNVKVGYVGMYPSAQDVSGYTAFYLGINSVYDKVAMEVMYTNTWHSAKKETEAAKKLIKDRCVVIGQSSNSSFIPSVCQKAKDDRRVVYSIGCSENALSKAKSATLTSAINKWEVYYTELFKAAKDDNEIPQDWAKGLESEAVAITELGPEVAQGTKETVDQTIAGIKDGSIKVFDTKTFTVNGKEVKSEIIDLSYKDSARNKIIFEGDQEEAIEDGAFMESTLRSAPYFSLRIDGITELNGK